MLTFGTSPKMTFPMAALKMDMMTRLAKAPKKTVIRGCLVAMIAAIRKVLSPRRICQQNVSSTSQSDLLPISETTIMMKALKRAAKG
jgi:hypothetical protein